MALEYDDPEWAEVSVPNSNVWESRAQFKLFDNVLEWLSENAGERQTMRNYKGNWRNTVPLGIDTTQFYFRDNQVAMLFKLTFG